MFIFSVPGTACPLWLMLYIVFLSAKDNYLCALLAPFLSIHGWLCECMCCVHYAHTRELWKQVFASCVVVGVLLLCDLRKTDIFCIITTAIVTWDSEQKGCKSLTISNEMCNVFRHITVFITYLYDKWIFLPPPVTCSM